MKKTKDVLVAFEQWLLGCVDDGSLPPGKLSFQRECYNDDLLHSGVRVSFKRRKRTVSFFIDRKTILFPKDLDKLMAAVIRKLRGGKASA